MIILYRSDVFKWIGELFRVARFTFYTSHDNIKNAFKINNKVLK